MLHSIYDFGVVRILVSIWYVKYVLWNSNQWNWRRRTEGEEEEETV